MSQTYIKEHPHQTGRELSYGLGLYEETIQSHLHNLFGIDVEIQQVGSSCFVRWKQARTIEYTFVIAVTLYKNLIT